MRLWTPGWCIGALPGQQTIPVSRVAAFAGSTFAGHDGHMHLYVEKLDHVCIKVWSQGRLPADRRNNLMKPWLLLFADLPLSLLHQQPLHHQLAHHWLWRCNTRPDRWAASCITPSSWSWLLAGETHQGLPAVLYNDSGWWYRQSTKQDGLSALKHVCRCLRGGIIHAHPHQRPCVLCGRRHQGMRL